ncbi:MAG: CinA family nicotinamide mononucleotide deamidase-related protein [Chitinophagia bacterium]|jgi:nicotinamide-nucleotide amidase
MNNQENIHATLITIGDELLIGQTIDTNSAWMATELNNIGVTVKRRVAVGDAWQEIWSALEEESQTAQLILITGGLGPTSDDITKPLLCEFFGGKMVVDEAARENVIEIFTKKLNRPLLDRNLKQAEVPNNCRVIQNSRGTAPGMWFEKNGVIFVSMPGVPNEMKGMMTLDVIPAIKERFILKPVQHRTLLTAGIGESFLAEKLIGFESELPSSIKMAYLPNYGMVRIRLSSQTDNAPVDEQFEKLKLLVSEYLVVDKDLTIQGTIAEKLLNRKQTLSVAESCTGGYISHLLTSIPGSSGFFLGSVIAYDNEVKKKLLGVDQESLDNHGAVSMETVIKMAIGVRERTGSDFSLATSGIMGPGGGTETKPVGTVYVACSTPTSTASIAFHFRFDRKRNIELTAAHALDFLRKNMG